jgi:hypothetical protein
MRKRDVFIAAGLAAMASVVVAPLIEVGIWWQLASAHALIVFMGALLATVFFAVGAITAAIYQGSPNLRTAVLMSYVVKTSIIFAGLQTIQLRDSDALPFAISVVVSGFTYLVVQTLHLVKWRKLTGRRLREAAGLKRY